METSYVQPNGEGRREVKKRSAGKASATFDTKAEAVERGREIAKKAKGSLVIEKADGTIEKEWSYGDDPFPPRG